LVGDEICDGAPEGCTDQCQPESGYECEPGLNQCHTVCPDGIIAGEEECDPLSSIPLMTEACLDNCTIDPHFNCDLTGASPQCFSLCGNGVRDATEKCDDGDDNDSNGCSNLCAVNDGFSCNVISDIEVCTEDCGDNLIVGDEECDPSVAGPFVP